MNAFSVAPPLPEPALPEPALPKPAGPVPESARPVPESARPVPETTRPVTRAVPQLAVDVVPLRADAAPRPVDVAAQIFAALKHHDVSIVDRAGHPDIFADFVAVGQFHGTPAVRLFFSDLFAAFPDFDITVTDMLSDDAYVIVRWEASGTFRGAPFQGIHATGRRADVRGCDVMRFEDGMLKHNTIYYDGLGFARQTGVLPMEGSVMDRAATAALNLRTDLRRVGRRFLRR
jgi:steroid delta-isomerase-like uncharacterized protein